MSQNLSFVKYPKVGSIVEFMQGNKPMQAYILEENTGSLRLYTISQREIKLNSSRLLPWIGPVVSGLENKESIQKILEEHKELRLKISEQINIQELWEMAQTEITKTNAEWFAELFWQNPNIDQIAAMGHCALNSKTYFKFSSPEFIVFSKEDVLLKLQQEEEGKEQKDFIANSHDFLKKLWDLNQKQNCQNKSNEEYLATLPNLSPNLSRKLELFLNQRFIDPDAHDSLQIWHELSKGLPDNQHLPLILLQTWGKIPEHYNYLLDRANYDPSNNWAEKFAPDILKLKELSLNHNFIDNPLPFISIDSSDTLDIDDAFCLSKNQNNEYCLNLAISCPALDWSFTSELDKAVIWRSSSLYLPEATSHMLPEELCLKTYSLEAKEKKATLLFNFNLNDQAEVIHTDIQINYITLAANLSYEDCEAYFTNTQENKEPVSPTSFSQNQSCLENKQMYNQANPAFAYASTLVSAKELSEKLQAARIKRGAIIIDRPENKIKLENINNEIKVQLEPMPACPISQLIVGEFMILTNTMLALWAKEKNIPLIYRSQNLTVPKEYSGLWTKSQDIARVLKVLTAAKLELNPKPHAGIGAGAYAPVTAPLRRYSDLINEAQIVNFLQNSKPKFTETELNPLLNNLTTRLEAVNIIQKNRPRYWKLLYIKQQGDKVWYEAVITDENDYFVTVNLCKEQLFVRGKRALFNDKINLGQNYLIRLGKVNPLNNDISIIDAKED